MATIVSSTELFGVAVSVVKDYFQPLVHLVQYVIGRDEPKGTTTFADMLSKSDKDIAALKEMLSRSDPDPNVSLAELRAHRGTGRAIRSVREIRFEADRIVNSAQKSRTVHGRVDSTSLHHHHDLEAAVRMTLDLNVQGSTQLVTKLGLPDDLYPSVLIAGERLSPTAASVGLGNLEIVAKRLLEAHADREPYFFGVNRGGSLIANLLTQRLDLHQKQLVRCDFNSDYKRIFCEDRPDVPLAIVVDDAVRSGRTLKAVRRHLQEKYPDALLYVLALVVSATDRAPTGSAQEFKIFDFVDYYPWISFDAETELPWTGGESDDATQYIDEEGLNQIVARSLALNVGTSHPVFCENEGHRHPLEISKI